MDMAKQTTLAKAGETATPVVNRAEFNKLSEAVAAELANQWNYLHGAMDQLEDGQEPKALGLSISVTMKKVKKETEEDLTFTLEGKHSMQTKKTSGTVAVIGKQLAIKFINEKDITPDDDEGDDNLVN